MDMQAYCLRGLVRVLRACSPVSDSLSCTRYFGFLHLHKVPVSVTDLTTDTFGMWENMRTVTQLDSCMRLHSKVQSGSLIIEQTDCWRGFITWPPHCVHDINAHSL
jgi:hypothetical protein